MLGLVTALLVTAVTPGSGAIIVTATRTPISADRVSSSVTILEKSEIDRSQAAVISDLLIRTPGVSFTRNGGFGTATSIRIRGAEEDQTVLVIDGVKLNDPSSRGSGYNFANLLTGDAARVEILRGPQSILWGSQAIGGVVNIVTVVPDRRLAGTIDLEAGSRETVNARAGIGGASDRVTWRIAGNAFATEGISAISPRFGAREKDGYSNAGGSGRLDVKLMRGVTADLRGYYSRARTDIDSAGTPPDSPEYSSNEEWTGYAALNVDLLGSRLRNRFAITTTDTTRENINPARLIRHTSFEARGRNRRFEYQGSLAIAPGWEAVFGAESERSRMRTASPADKAAPYVTVRGAATIDSVYGQVNGTIVDGLTLTGGIRYDHHDSFGGNTVLGAGAAWALPDGNTILRASYDEGFKAPTLYQLFTEYGNAALVPEKAHGWDAGIERHLFDDKVVLAATYFERTTANLILFNGCPTTSRPPLCFTPGTTTPRLGYYSNVARSQAHGLEAGAAATFGGLKLDGNYTWTVAKDRSPGPNFGNQLARRPRHSANGSVTYAWQFGLSTGIAVRWSGSSLDTNRTSPAVAPFVNAAYTVVDLRAELPLAPQILLFGRIENLFDEYYETARRYGQLGRSVYTGVRARF